MTEVRLTQHAVTRFQERVRPGLPREAAQRELEALIAQADEPVTEPLWPVRKADGYVVLTEDIMLPCHYSRRRKCWDAHTCVTRGGLTPEKRAYRNARNARRRERRRLGRSKRHSRQEKKRVKRGTIADHRDAA